MAKFKLDAIALLYVFNVKCSRVRLLSNKVPIKVNEVKHMGNILKNPIDHVKEVISFAFDVRSNKRKHSLRVLKQVLVLAEQRGYTDINSFMAHFQSYFEPQQKNNEGFGKRSFDRLSTKYLNDLFEYVSSDEIVRLSQVSTVTI